MNDIGEDRNRNQNQSELNVADNEIEVKVNYLTAKQDDSYNFTLNANNEYKDHKKENEKNEKIYYSEKLNKPALRNRSSINSQSNNINNVERIKVKRRSSKSKRSIKSLIGNINPITLLKII